MSEFDPIQATAREDLCRFLSACYYEPAAEFEEEKLFESMLLAATHLDADLAASAGKLGQAFASQDLQTLLVDYTRLFLGPIEAQAKPYASCWLPAIAPAEDNPPPAVLELYSEGGFEVGEDFPELPDHIAVELEFLYLLIFKHSRALAAGDVAQVQIVEVLKSRFLREHLAAWVGPFAAAVRAGATTDFYRQLADITERYVGLELAKLPLH